MQESVKVGLGLGLLGWAGALVSKIRSRVSSFILQDIVMTSHCPAGPRRIETET